MALAADSHPHSTTIARFIASMEDEITPLLRNVLLICSREGLIGGQMFAIDVIVHSEENLRMVLEEGIDAYLPDAGVSVTRRPADDGLALRSGLKTPAVTRRKGRR